MIFFYNITFLHNAFLEGNLDAAPPPVNQPQPPASLETEPETLAYGAPPPDEDPEEPPPNQEPQPPAGLIRSLSRFVKV